MSEDDWPYSESRDVKELRDMFSNILHISHEQVFLEQLLVIMEINIEVDWDEVKVTPKQEFEWTAESLRNYIIDTYGGISPMVRLSNPNEVNE